MAGKVDSLCVKGSHHQIVKVFAYEHNSEEFTILAVNESGVHYTDVMAAKDVVLVGPTGEKPGIDTAMRIAMVMVSKHGKLTGIDPRQL